MIEETTNCFAQQVSHLEFDLLLFRFLCGSGGAGVSRSLEISKKIIKYEFGVPLQHILIELKLKLKLINYKYANFIDTASF
jgi:hypothetical protein